MYIQNEAFTSQESETANIHYNMDDLGNTMPSEINHS